MIEIRNSFIDEAKQAPDLFSDLARVELYISESYRTRALIEMLQNADDAEACNFFVLQDQNSLIVANNGKCFTSLDLHSLCRSGSSTKVRGAGKIGYRGIGFKAVAGLCSHIKVYSGELSFQFSKEQTRDYLNITSDVPLIRIPHELDINERDKLVTQIPELSDYSTIFVLYGINKRILSEELSLFNSSACLFLNNVKSLQLDISNQTVEIEKMYSSSNQVKVYENGKIEHWKVLCSTEHSSKVGLLLVEGDIFPASIEESVFHAFLPTEQNVGAFLKINGDFSTDPSRKHIDFDDKSELAFTNCCRLIADQIVIALKEHSNIGLFTAFKDSPNNRFKKLMREKLISMLDTKLRIEGENIVLGKLRTKPKWLNYKDYTAPDTSFSVVSKALDESFPELQEFFTWLGVAELSVDECIEHLKSGSLSTLGYFELISQIGKKFRFTLSNELLVQLENTPMFPTEQGSKSALELESFDNEVSEAYKNLVNNSENISDIKYLFKRLAITSLIFDESTIKKVNVESKVSANSKVSFPSQIKKWRSAEVNVKEWFSNLPNVLLAKDVSKSHVGYDVEVKFKSGKELYIEVKSVNSFNDSFEITNNEYAIGSQLNSDYLIAVVVEGTGGSRIKFIRDPIKVLAFEKRIKSVSWVCDTYEQHLSDL